MNTKGQQESKKIYFDHIPVPYQSLNKDGYINRVNSKWLKILGYTKKEVFNKHFSNFLSDSSKEKFKKGFVFFKKNGFINNIVFEMVKKCKNSLIVSFEGQIESDKSGNFFQTHCIFSDITEKEKNKKLIETQKIQERMMEEKLFESQKFELIGQLAGGIAHDFNNLLQVMQGYSNFLIEKLDNIDDREVAQDIFYCTEKAADLTRQLLAFSQKQVLTTEKLDLNTFISLNLKVIKRILGEQVELSYSPCMDFLISMADHSQLEQVFLNICINAKEAIAEMKTVPKGGPKLSIKTKLMVLKNKFCQENIWARPGRYALISIKDNGPGMDAMTLKRIFEPFFTTHEIGRGTGLGLAAVHGIIKQHNGFINVISEHENGTDFQIFLPISMQSLSKNKNENQLFLKRANEKTVLIAEDDPTVRNLVCRMLKKNGYNLILAQNGLEACELIKEHYKEIDFLLLDVLMPGKKGGQVYDFFSTYRPDPPTLFMSGYTSGSLNKKILKKSNVEFITKPFSLGKLIEIIRYILDEEEVKPPPELIQ